MGKKLAAYLTLFLALGSLALASGFAYAPGKLTQTVKKERLAASETLARTVAIFANTLGLDNEPRLDSNGDPPPPGALNRIGSNRFLHGGHVTGVLYTRDGKGIASISSDGYLRLWDAATGKLRWRIEMDHTIWDRVLAMSGDGKKVAVLSDSEFRVVATDTGKSLVRHDLPEGSGPNHRMPCLAIAPDLGTFARAFKSFARDPGVQLFDAVSGQEKNRILRQQKGHQPIPLALALSEDGKKIYVVPHQEEGVLVFDTTNAKAEKTLEMGTFVSNIRQLVLSQNHQLLADIEPSNVFLWDLKAGKQRQLMAERGGSCGAFSADDNHFAVGGFFGGIDLFDTATGKKRCTLHASPGTRSLAFAPNGKTLAVGNDGGSISLWDIATGHPLPPAAGPMGLSDMRFADDGNQLLLSGLGITSWDVASGKPVRRFEDPIWNNAQVVSPNGKLLASRKQGSVAIIDAATGANLRTLPESYSSTITTMLFSPDSTKLFSAGGPSERSIHIWDATAGKTRHVLQSPTFAMDILAVSPNGRWLASATRGRLGAANQILLWEVATGELIQRLPQRASVCSMAFSPDSARLVSVGGEPGRANSSGEVQLWDVTTGKETRAFAGHKGNVLCVAMTADGRMLATGSEDNTLR